MKEEKTPERNHLLSVLVPTSETGGDEELRCCLSQTYLLKKQVGKQRISKAQIKKNEANPTKSAC